ncbi:hypothetical protein [Streptomyces sp. NPDC048309]|uniref:hypothetical protein n=1 Tax=Streptomyces sp. NPDC048309 TaxID=3154618 RepID=UPI0033FE2CE0
MIEAVQSELVDVALEEMNSERDVTALIQALDSLADAATEVEVVGSLEVENTNETSNSESNSGGIKFTLARPNLEANLSATTEAKQLSSARRKVTGDLRFAVKFGPLSNALRRVVKRLPKQQVWVLLDEWSALPMDLQPLLADLLRRAFFPIAGVVVKIAAIERRSKFSVRGEQGDYLGIELGADASQDVNLDDYLIFSGGDERARSFFGDLLLRHTAAISADIAHQFPITPAGRQQFIDSLWYDSFEEFIQSAEGIPRDGINIAGLAAQRASSPIAPPRRTNASDVAPPRRHSVDRDGEPGWFRRIAVADVRDAARSWFLRDKEAAIKDDKMAARALLHLVSFCLQRRKRSFLIERGHDSNHAVVQVLYDARLIHLLNSGVGPRGHYDLFTLDYGGFINALGNNESVSTWQDLWTAQWTELDPSRSPLVREAIISVEILREKPRPLEE